MSTIHTRLREARIAAGFETATDAATALGLRYQTYVAHENGKTGVRTPAAEKYARRFGVSLDWLVSNRGPMRPESGSSTKLTYKEAFGMPVLGRVLAGSWLDTAMMHVDSDPQKIPLIPDDRYRGDQYALEVQGNSMNKLFADGTFVVAVDFASSGLELKPGMIAHVERRRYDGQLVETTLKMLERTGDKWRLVPQSTDPVWQPIDLGAGDQDEEVVIRGVVISAYRQIVI